MKLVSGLLELCKPVDKLCQIFYRIFIYIMLNFLYLLQFIFRAVQKAEEAVQHFVAVKQIIAPPGLWR